jgi:hypothetical protein
MSYWRKLSKACRITLILMVLGFVFLIAIGHYNDAVFVLGLTPLIVGIVWARDQWRKRHPRPQPIPTEEEKIRRAAEAGRKIREAELQYQAKRAEKRQAKLKDAVMLGLERVLGPEYHLINGVLFSEGGRRASFPGLSPPVWLTWLRPKRGLRPTVSVAPSGPKRKINEAWPRSAQSRIDTPPRSARRSERSPAKQKPRPKPGQKGGSNAVLTLTRRHTCRESPPPSSPGPG